MLGAFVEKTKVISLNSIMNALAENIKGKKASILVTYYSLLSPHC